MELEDDEPDTETPHPSDSHTIGGITYLYNPQLSLQTLTGVSNYHKMRISGLHGNKLLQILVDSGSTHNFLDIEVAKKLGCKLDVISPLTVTAGGGYILEAPYICRGFQWVLQQTKFTADVIVLLLVCCDLS